MKGIPFNAYDIFAYLGSGFFVIGAADYAFPVKWILDTNLAGAAIFVWIVLAYILGHVVAQVSATLLEKRLVRLRLGYPTKALFGTANSNFKLLFPGYFEPIPEEIRDRVRTYGRKTDITDDAALFLYCEARARRNELIAGLLSTFLSMYGFARNLCVAALTAAVLLGIGAGAHADNRETKLWLMGAALGAAIFLLYRYLKFFRVYAMEVFCAYAAEFPAASSSA